MALTAAQKRQKVADKYREILGRNTYSQHAEKRECTFKKYSDGKYYSDCSSSVRLAYKEADVGFSNIGSSTIDQYSNKNLKTVSCKIVNGVPTDVSALRVGDLLLFAGSDTGRAYVDYVGHVEMVYRINRNTVTMCGHGSGNPRTTEMAAYCKSRQNTNTSTKKGNRGLLKVVRAIADDDSGTVPADPMKEPPKPVKGVRITGGSVNLRYGPGTEYAVAGEAKKGDVFEHLVNITSGNNWLPILHEKRVLWVSPNMSEKV